MFKSDDLQLKGRLKITCHDAKTGRKKWVSIHDNIITTAAKESIADGLRGGTDKGVITYCALGSDDTPPGLGSTTLGTEFARKQVSVRSVTNNVAKFQTFFNISEGNGTIKELGLFGDDATAVADSGTLFAHTADDRVKSANDTLTVEWDIVVG